MLRALLAATVTATLLTFTPAAEARKPCVLHGRELRNLEDVTCAKAKKVFSQYVGTLHAPFGWVCLGYRGQLWRGYCESNVGAYFTWKPLT